MISFNQLGNLGRIGNQMFQYASLKGISLNRNFKFCIPPKTMFGKNDTYLIQNNIESKFGLYDLFDLNVTNDTTDFTTIRETGTKFDSNLYNNCPDNINLYGFFQSEKYFLDIKEIILQDFVLKLDIQQKVDQIKKNMTKEIISLHVRRKDYTNLKNVYYFCDLSYYRNALEFLPKHINVMVFSDDIQWCKEQTIFQEDRFCFSQYDERIDMGLMSVCDYHIISNSTFGWWGAWLANKNNVIAPKNWFVSKDSSDIIPERWKKI